MEAMPITTHSSTSAIRRRWAFCGGGCIFVDRLVTPSIALAKRRQVRKGFTLIELLVVIAIIAMLMAIIVPSLNRVLRKAKTVRCASRLQQLGVAHTLYQTEHDGYLAHSVSSDPPQNNDIYFAWADKLAPYVGFTGSSNYPFQAYAKPSTRGQNNNVFTCPEQPKGNLGGLGSSFSVNAHLGDVKNGRCYYPAYRIWKFAEPSRKAFLFDGIGYRVRTSEFYWGPGLTGIQLRHDGRANFLMLDGHVTTVESSQVPYAANSVLAAQWLSSLQPGPPAL